MEDNKSDIQKKITIPDPKHIIRQRIWCDKQKRIFYDTGRPIFNICYDSKHIFYKRSTNDTYIGLFE